MTRRLALSGDIEEYPGQTQDRNTSRHNILVRITARTTMIPPMGRLVSKLRLPGTSVIRIKTEKLSPTCIPRIALAKWNVHSINKNSSSVCDLVIFKRTHALNLTETWLSENKNCNID